MDKFPENPVEFIKEAQKVEKTLNEIYKILRCRPDNILEKIIKVQSRTKELKEQINNLKKENNNDKS